jgi:hypothetical protein
VDELLLDEPADIDSLDIEPPTMADIDSLLDEDDDDDAAAPQVSAVPVAGKSWPAFSADQK